LPDPGRTASEAALLAAWQAERESRKGRLLPALAAEAFGFAAALFAMKPGEVGVPAALAGGLTAGDGACRTRCAEAGCAEPVAEGPGGETNACGAAGFAGGRGVVAAVKADGGVGAAALRGGAGAVGLAARGKAVVAGGIAGRRRRLAASAAKAGLAPGFTEEPVGVPGGGAVGFGAGRATRAARLGRSSGAVQAEQAFAKTHAALLLGPAPVFAAALAASGAAPGVALRGDLSAFLAKACLAAGVAQLGGLARCCHGGS